VSWGGAVRRGAALVLAVLTLELLFAPVSASQAVLEQIVVDVNGDVITKMELDERLRVTRRLASEPDVQRRTADPGSLPTAAALLPGLLSDAIDELLMLQRAADIGITASDADIDATIAGVKAQSRVASDAEFDELLRREGISPAALRVSTRRQILLERLRQDLFQRVSVSDDEARSHYAAHRPDLARSAVVTFREIRVAVPAERHGAEKARDDALIKVVAAGDRLAAGADFAQVARDFSEAPSNAAGGLVGPVDPGELDAAVQRALAALNPRAVSAPVRTAGAYYYLRLESAGGPVLRSFDECRDEIIARLLPGKQRARLEEVLRRLRASAMLRWRQPELEAAYARR
jgi:parvulin-like peptidyl-prolyl isomerase